MHLKYSIYLVQVPAEDKWLQGLSNTSMYLKISLIQKLVFEAL